MTGDQDFAKLRERFKNIKEQYDSGNLKYIHSKTIDNLLYHADSFWLNHHKNQIDSTLTEYFDTIEANHIASVYDALELFNKYIRPLTKLYADLREFHLAIKFWILLTWALPIFLLLYFVDASYYFYAGLFILYALAIFRNYYFESKKKTYAFLY